MADTSGWKLPDRPTGMVDNPYTAPKGATLPYDSLGAQLMAALGMSPNQYGGAQRFSFANPLLAGGRYVGSPVMTANGGGYALPGQQQGMPTGGSFLAGNSMTTPYSPPAAEPAPSGLLSPQQPQITQPAVTQTPSPVTPSVQPTPTPTQQSGPTGLLQGSPEWWAAFAAMNGGGDSWGGGSNSGGG